MVFEQVTNINVSRSLKVFSGVLSNQIHSVQSGFCFETRYHACGMKGIKEWWNLRISKETKLRNSDTFVCSKNVKTSCNRKLQSVGIFMALLPDEDKFPSNQINRNDEKQENEMPRKVFCKEKRRKVNWRMYKVHWTPCGLTLLHVQGVLSALSLSSLLLSITWFHFSSLSLLYARQVSHSVTWYQVGWLFWDLTVVAW